MTHPHAHRIADLVAEARASADDIHHEWDRKALEWSLDSNSVVLEAGGYRGRWSLQMARRYNPRLFVFEPQPWLTGVLTQVLEGYNATVLPYGLGDRDAHLPMGDYETDGCSFVRQDRQQGLGDIRDVAGVVKDLGITNIDVMLVNIEGYEYTLIPHMLRQGVYPKHLVVQFHAFEGMTPEQLRTLIEERYALLWDYGDTLAAWELR